MLKDHHTADKVKSAETTYDFELETRDMKATPDPNRFIGVNYSHVLKPP